jgi:hypothetical protein
METEYEPNSYERFLLYHRPICEVDFCMKPSVRIESLYSKPVAMCENHWQSVSEPAPPPKQQ